SRRLPPRPPAPPTFRQRLTRRLAPTVGGAVLLVGALVMVFHAGGAPPIAPGAAPVTAAARCTPSDIGAPVVHDAEGCSWSAAVRGNEIELRSNGRAPVRIGLGREGDVAVVGDWSCQSALAPGL